MKNIVTLLTELFEHAFYQAYPDLATAEHRPNGDVTLSKSHNFGQYQCNAPLKLAKLLGLSPKTIAEQVIKHVSLMHDGERIIDKLEVAGPGFINIFIAREYISWRVTHMLRDKRFGIDYPEQPRSVIIDFSSPNVAKEMHVGHLRSTIIGDSLARVFEFLGHNVLRLNHIGDWGTSFGMLIAYMKQHASPVLAGQKSTDLTELVAWYKAAKKQFDDDADFKKSAQLEVVLLQNGDKNALAAWEIICAISRAAYQELYDLLAIKLIERGESFYNQLLPEIVADLTAKNLITISGGARCIFLDGFKGRDGEPLPLMIQKSDGGYNYDTTDLAALRHRVMHEKADSIFYVTDAGQALHFKMIFAAGEKAGYFDPKKTTLEHVAFGLVLGGDGKKFKTRSGDTERLVDLLHTAIERARSIIEEKSPELSREEKAHLAHVLGIGAVKYADLSTNRTGDYLFSYDKMLRFDGNTAVFLLYTYVRAQSIKRRFPGSLDSLIVSEKIIITHSSEFDLSIHLAQFNETITAVARDLMPNKLTDYLYQLAEKFNAFFRDCRVEGSEHQNSRLLLCHLFSRVMKQGLELLGIETVERM